MGVLIRFPEQKPERAPRACFGVADVPAAILILPVVRIERHAEERPSAPGSDTGARGGGRRKRPVRRS